MSVDKKDIASAQVKEIKACSPDESPASQPHAVRPSPRTSLAYAYWYREIFGCVLSAGALLAIAIILVHYNGSPLPRWPAVISLNTIISILIIALKGNMLRAVAECICQLKWNHFQQPRPLIDLVRYDAASRDPVDAAFLLMRFPRSFLTFIGVFITIAGLAIGPFCQQLVQYVECRYPDTQQTALIARTNNYSITGLHIGPISKTVDRTTIGAFYRGMFNPPDDPASMIPTKCPTGNCTFPAAEGVTHTSLGMCYFFQDLNDTVSTTVADNSSFRVGYTDYVLNTGLRLNVSNSDTLVTQKVDNASNILTFDTLMLKSYGCSDDEPNCPNLAPYAFRSGLVPCVRDYFASIANNKLTEKIVSVTPLTHEDDWAFDSWLAANRTLRNGTWQECNPQTHLTQNNPVRVPLPRTTTTTTVPNDVPASNATVQYYPDDCVWSFPFDAKQPFDNLATKLFDRLALNSGTYPLPNRATGPDHLLVLARNGTADSASISAFLNDLALSITADMRTRGDSALAGWTAGTVYVSDTCVNANWPWISLPAALILITVALVTVVVMQNAKSTGLPPWKSSGLPLALFSLDNQEMLRSGTLNNIKSMQNTANEVKATLIRQSDGSWTFIEAEGQSITAG